MSKKNALAGNIDISRELTKPSSKTTLQLTSSVVQSCSDSKGIDVTVLDVSKVFGLSDYFVIVSGRSDRHVQGLVNRVVNTLTEQGTPPLAVEGYENGHWIIVDCGEVILHAFYQPIREIYDIEGLWAEAPRIAIKPQNRSAERSLQAA